MSKKAFKSQASSSRAFSTAFDGVANGQNALGFGGVHQSQLSHVYEPPDLSSLSDPNVAVNLKNVQKKDRTTKAKALEELGDYVQSLKDGSGGMEESFLIAWTKVYPRTSIDNSRRVRQLAHTLQGQIALSCGKQIVKYMPQLVPSWLAGVYDNDKSISRSAQDSFKIVFPTQDKYNNVWKIYQREIAAYSRDVIQYESPGSLSDERTTSPDDANYKYSRTTVTAIMLITHLLNNFSRSDLAKIEAEIDGLVASDQLWKLSANDDPFTRRAVYQLLLTLLNTHPDSLDPTTLANSILQVGLHTDQHGSALDFAQAVLQLTVHVPSVWTSHYEGSGKKSAKNRICSFVKRGSQGATAEFWSTVAEIIQRLPHEIWNGGKEAIDETDAKSEHPALEILRAMRQGIAAKDEIASNASTAWKSYLTVCTNLCKAFSDLRSHVAAVYVNPLFHQYIKPNSETSQWSIRGSGGLEVCAIAGRLAIDLDEDQFILSWRALSSQLQEDMKASQPEQASQYVKSQDSIASQMGRYYNLCQQILEAASSSAFKSMTSQCLSNEVAVAVELVKNRNGKPYGAASALTSLTQVLGKGVDENQTSKDQLKNFVLEDLPNLILTPSAKYLAQLLDNSSPILDVSQPFVACLRTLEMAPSSLQKREALQIFLVSSHLEKTPDASSLFARILDRALLNDEDEDRSMIDTILTNKAASKDLSDSVLSSLTRNLSIQETSEAAVQNLSRLEKKNAPLLRRYVASGDGAGLLSRLIFLSESSGTPEAKQARELSNALQRRPNGFQEIDGQANASVTLLQENLATATPQSLLVGSLTGQAQQLVDSTPKEKLAGILEQILPTDSQWASALSPFTTRLPNASLATCTRFGSLLALIVDEDNQSDELARDNDGNSILGRLVQYTVATLSDKAISEYLSDQQKCIIARNLQMFVELASDNISVSGSNPIWLSLQTGTDAVMSDVVSNSESLVLEWSRSPDSEVGSATKQSLLESFRGLSSAAYYSARAFARLSDELPDIRDPNELALKTARASALKDPDVFKAVALFSSAAPSPETLRSCNELIAGLTGRDLSANEPTNLKHLVMLNCLLSGDSDYLNDVPQQRLVFFIKHTIQSLNSTTFELETEILKSLNWVVRPVKEIYGTFWTEMFEALKACVGDTTTEKDLPRLAAALQLCYTLQQPWMQSGNDDILEAWGEQRPAIAESLFSSLIRFKDFADDSHQPRYIVNTWLSKLLGVLDSSFLPNLQELYCVIDSKSETLQSKAFSILASQIPETQEEQSLEKGLNPTFAGRLPDELLSLVMTPPSLDEIAEMSFDRSIPLTFKSYLLSWELIFKHWEKSSSAIQQDYSKTLEEAGYLPQILEIAIDVLVTSPYQPIKASKFDIENYFIDPGEQPERELQWLLSHLYYLTLLRLPSQAKAWWRDLTSRQTNTTVETWTEQYISPRVISSELSAVKAWAATQDSTQDSPLSVKVSHTTKEITASIPIDERQTSIAIRLPPSYPLNRAEVTGVQRVAVAENKWQAWIRNAQGQLTVSDGGSNALIDCLLAWRRNVTAAMKGQTECAICYSVVGGDKTLPKKECPTCKNRFHSSCLFRWFKSSNSSSCPLCRNTFAYS